MRRAGLALSVSGLAGPLLLVLGADSMLVGARPEWRPHAGPLPPVEPTQTLRPGEDEDGDGLDDALELQVALRHAPRFRFAKRDPTGPSSRQNRDEAFFPMSVARFLGGLESGVYRLEEGTVQALQAGTFDDGGRVRGFPWGLTGDPLGEAPIYTHVYPGSAGQVICEYWVFYGHDRADARVLGVTLDTGGHRGDWEHVAYRINLDPPRVEEGYYYGHAHCLVVPRDRLERVEGEHPVVYVSQGKHAAYPEPCMLATVGLPSWLVDHQDVANGRGPSWDTWLGPLIDLGERERPRAAVADWLSFAGRWGPDGTVVAGLELGASPTGPTAKTSWRNNGEGTPWDDWLEQRGERLR